AHLGEEIEVRLDDARPGVRRRDELGTGPSQLIAERGVAGQQLADLSEFGGATVADPGARAPGHPRENRGARVHDPRASGRPCVARKSPPARSAGTSTPTPTTSFETRWLRKRRQTMRRSSSVL